VPQRSRAVRAGDAVSLDVSCSHKCMHVSLCGDDKNDDERAKIVLVGERDVAGIPKALVPEASHILRQKLTILKTGFWLASKISNVLWNAICDPKVTHLEAFLWNSFWGVHILQCFGFFLVLTLLLQF